MSAETKCALAIWRCLFLAMEAVVLAGVVVWLVDEFVLELRLHAYRGTWVMVVGVIFLFSWLFLLIVSPFFLRSLKGIALAGWLIAFGFLFLGMLFPAKPAVKAQPAIRR